MIVNNQFQPYILWRLGDRLQAVADTRAAGDSRQSENCTPLMLSLLEKCPD